MIINGPQLHEKRCKTAARNTARDQKDINIRAYIYYIYIYKSCRHRQMYDPNKDNDKWCLSMTSGSGNELIELLLVGWYERTFIIQNSSSPDAQTELRR